MPQILAPSSLRPHHVSRQGAVQSMSEVSSFEPGQVMSFDPEVVPSGKHTKSYWKWPFIVDFPIKNGDFP